MPGEKGKPRRVEDPIHEKLSVGAIGFYDRLKKGIESGRSFNDVLAEVKAEIDDLDFDAMKRDNLSEAIEWIVRLFPNPPSKKKK